MSTESNLKESLKNSRVLCPGLCEIDYTVADALSEAIIDCELPPSALVQNLALVFARPDDNHPVEDDGVFIPQIIDAIASKEFADEFRNLCKDVFDWDTTQRFNVTTSGYEDKPHIKFAADWWTGRIQRQTTTSTSRSGEKWPRQSLVQFTPEMISRFHTCLASEIEKEIGWNVYHTSHQKTKY